MSSISQTSSTCISNALNYVLPGWHNHQMMSKEIETILASIFSASSSTFMNGPLAKEALKEIRLSLLNDAPSTATVTPLFDENESVGMTSSKPPLLLLKSILYQFSMTAQFFKKVGDYDITKKLTNNSAVGQVRVAEHVKTKEKLAVTIIKRSRLKKRNSIDFISEQIANMKLLRYSSSNIVRFKDVLQTSNNIYFFTELIGDHNTDLVDRVTKARYLKEPEAHGYFVQLILAVRYLHLHHIAHRKLNLENLLLDRNDTLKVANVGIASIVEDDLDQEITNGSKMGYSSHVTPELHYFAPEMLRRVADINDDNTIAGENEEQEEEQEEEEEEEKEEEKDQRVTNLNNDHDENRNSEDATNDVFFDENCHSHQGVLCQTAAGTEDKPPAVQFSDDGRVAKPENALPEETLNPNNEMNFFGVDMWSCGVILYIMLSGHYPFDRSNRRELIKIIIAGKFRMSSKIGPKAAHLINKLLEVDPTKRYTVEDVIHDEWFKGQ